MTTTFSYNPWLPGIDFRSQIRTLDEPSLAKLAAGIQTLVSDILDTNDKPRPHGFGVFGGLHRRRAMSQMTHEFDLLCAEVGITIDLPISLVDHHLKLSKGDGDIGERLAFLLWANICDAKLRSAGHGRWVCSVARRWLVNGLQGVGVKKVPVWLGRPPRRQRDTLTMLTILELGRTMGLFWA